MFLLEYIFIVLIINVWIINRLFTVVIEILNQRSIRVKNKKRLAWIDIAKGLGMICVVMGHSFLLNAQALYMKAIIYGFHMPLFFIISGYLINDSMNRGKIIKKRVQSLLIPYVTYSIIIRLFNIVLDYIRGIKHNMFNDVVGSIVQIRGTNYSGVVWFLTWMFVSQLIMLIILKIATTEIWRNIICIILFLIGSIITNVLRYKLPWHVDAAFISVLFLRFGMIYKNKQKIVDKYITKYILIIICVYFVVLAVNVKVFSKQYIDLYDGRIGNPLLYVIAAVLGSFVMIWIAKQIDENSKICYCLSAIGRHSMTIYGLHTMLCTIFYHVFIRIGLSDGNGWIEILRAIFCTSMCLIIIVPIGRIMEKKGAILFGYKKG